MMIGWPYVFVPRDSELFSANITFVTLENADGWRKPKPFLPMIVAPYPSFGHFNKPNGGDWTQKLFLNNRQVYIFISAKSRNKVYSQTQPLRIRLSEAMSNVTTRLPYKNYYKFHKLTPNSTVDIVNYKLSVANSNSVQNLIEWMRNSVFCLQPPGDSFTRKGFYDSILCGCIPVIFQTTLVEHVTYPFESFLDYSTFTVMIPADDILSYQAVLQRYTTSDIAVLQANLLKVMQYLQYNDLGAENVGVDAFTMIIRDLQLQQIKQQKEQI